MNAYEDPASLAAYLQAVGYDADDVAGCVRVKVAYGCIVTIECEPDRLRVIPRVDGMSLRGALWLYVFNLCVGIGLYFGLNLFMGESAGTAALCAAVWVAFGLPALIQHIVRDMQAQSAANTLRLLIAFEGLAPATTASTYGPRGSLARKVS